MPTSSFPFDRTNDHVSSPPAFEVELPTSSFRPFDDIRAEQSSMLPLSTSIDSDLTTVSDTVRPVNRGFSHGPSASSSLRPIPIASLSGTDSSRQIPPKPFAPHSGDLFGSGREMNRRASTSRTDVPPAQDSQAMDLDFSSTMPLYHSQTDALATASLQDYASDYATNSQSSTHSDQSPLFDADPVGQDSLPAADHAQQPSEPDFDGQFALYPGMQNRHGESSSSQLRGLYPYPYPEERHGIPLPYNQPFSYTQPGPYQNFSNTHRQSTPYNPYRGFSSTYPYHMVPPPTYPYTSPVYQQPPVRNPQQHGSSAIPIAPHQAPAPVPFFEEAAEGSGLHSLLLGYGMTGPHLEQTSRPLISPVSNASNTATLAPSRVVSPSNSSSAGSFVPSVPPPRPARPAHRRTQTPPQVELFHSDSINFSPHLIGRSRDSSNGSAVARSEVDRGGNEIRPRSQFISHRLGRLDALRTQYGRAPSATAAQSERERTSWLDREWDVDSDFSAQTARWSSGAAETSSRQGRFGLDDTRDLRSRPGRRTRVSDQLATSDRDEDDELSVWNQDILHSVSRRVAGDRAQSPASALRRLHDLNVPYPSTAQQDDLDMLERQRIDIRTTRPWQNLWGGIPIDTATATGGMEREQLQLPMTYHNWQPSDHAARSEAARMSLADSTRRQQQMIAAFRQQQADEQHARMYAQESFRERIGRYAGLGVDAEQPYHPYFLDSLDRDRVFEPASHCSVLAHLRLTPEMSDTEKAKVLKSLVRGVDRLPSALRRKLAEDTVGKKMYDEIVATEEMEKDSYCAVCHDEYEPKSEIGVTPCNHMYHKNCLGTWLATPKTSSCPMCRRDLAVLACITNIISSKKGTTQCQCG